MKRRVFLAALTLSLLAHLLLLGSGLLPETVIDLPPPEKLRKVDVALQSMRLEPEAPAAPPSASLVPAAGAPVKTPAKPKPAKRKRAASAPLAQQEASAPAVAESSAPAAEIAAAAPRASAHPLGPQDKREASQPHAAQASAPAAETLPGHLVAPDKLKSFPRVATLDYQGFYGKILAGSGVLNWQRNAGAYTLEIRFRPVIGPELRYVSQGSIGKSGLMPDSLQAWRGQEAKESARFDHEAGLLHFGGQGEKQEALSPGAQDVFSLAFQLALKGGQLGEAPLQITSGKKVYHYPMRPSGETDYDTGAGKIRVIVFRAQGDGDTNEFWLAPDFANLPVRITRIDKDKTIDLRAVSIEVNGKQEWKLPPQPAVRNKNAY